MSGFSFNLKKCCLHLDNKEQERKGRTLNKINQYRLYPKHHDCSLSPVISQKLKFTLRVRIWADLPHRRLCADVDRGATVLLWLWCASRGCIRAVAEVSWCLCEWKSRRRGSGVCRSDGDYSLIAKQILHSSNKRDMSHTSNRKAMLQDQTTVTVVTGSIFVNFYTRKKYRSNTWRSVCHPVCYPVCPTDSSAHFCLKNTVCPQQQSQAAPAVEQKTLTHMSLSPSTIVLFYLLSLETNVEKKNSLWALPSRLQWTFPQKTASLLQVREPDRVYCLLMVIMFLYN